MSTYNEFEDRNLDIEEQLVKRHFWFLVDEYRFVYEKHNFRSEKMLIQIEPGHKTPRIYIFKIGEPDPDLFRLNFEWIIRYFTGISPSDNHDYLKYSLGENMTFISRVFYENSHKLINELDNWWIPVHLFCYRTAEKKYRDEVWWIRLFRVQNGSK